MEIDRSNFWEKLPTILETISESQYVAVDLEMSGIQVHNSQQAPLPAKPTLQEMYVNAKMAAETYTILQFGFTCISWDAKKESYVTKTFNVPLHPGAVLDSTLTGDPKRASQQLLNVVDRCFRLSTNTLKFLEDACFSIPDVFQKGVPFLSEGEVRQQEIVDFIDGKRQTENLINVHELSPRSKDFRNDVEEKIINWEKKPRLGGRQEPLRIDCANGDRFNSLEKRLVHELLQDQHPHLQAVAQHKGKYMLINDPIEYTSGLKRYEREEAVRRQIGARLLWDAICGQPFADNVDHRRIAGDNPGEATMLRATLQGYERRLQSNRPVVIGHNILMDLCFLQSHFVGPLPPFLHKFRALTRGRMPRVVDTKYLFTRGGDEMSPDYSLKECFKTMGEQELPAVAPDPSHRYFKPLDHEAGWDSKLTTHLSRGLQGPLPRSPTTASADLLPHENNRLHDSVRLPQEVPPAFPDRGGPLVSRVRGPGRGRGG